MSKTGRIIQVCIGTMLMGIGIQVIVTAGQGMDSVSTLISGLMQHTTIPFGRWSQIISLLFLGISFLYNRKMLGIGSVINTLLVGETIRWVQPAIENSEWLQGQLIVSFFGFLIMAFGTALYLAADLGSGPLEGMMFCVCSLLKVSLQRGRVLLDFLIVLAGVLLGSFVGWGTLFAIFLLGPTIQVFLNLGTKVNLKIKADELS
ncbi:membrane protein [Enterococcus florum]|uniref:Membrane protein n=1 Tax=Enterococcus florum TaxID=2480627 RepID=A0A4P5P9N9_9ENTE|nr:YitT family protein [Enterococcus florum]GCF94797.1 membrane protein [Enterococcus florum]